MTPILPLLLLIAAPPKSETAPAIVVAPPPPPGVGAPVRVAPPLDPERLAAALELHEPEEMKQVMLATGVRLTLSALDTERKVRERRGEKIPDALYDKMKAFVVEDITRTYETLGPALPRRVAMIYAKYFTAAELRELKALYALPVMRKMERLSPSITVEVAEIGMRAAEARAPERQRRLQQMIEQWMADERLRRNSKSGT